MSGRSRWLCGVAALLLAGVRAAPAPWLARGAPDEGFLQSESDAAPDENKYYELQYNTLDYAMSDVTRRGSAYLEGLRRSLERLTESDPAACDPGPLSPAQLLASPPSNATNSTTSEHNSAVKGAVERCEERRRATLGARGAAALALHTTRLLARPDLSPRREAELVARLAALLHSLAGTLGYRYTPDSADTAAGAATTAPGAAAASGSQPPPPAPETMVPPHYMNASGEQVRQMILCLDPLASANDSRPSYERCPPLPPPPPPTTGAGVAEQQAEAGSRRRRRAEPELLRVESDSAQSGRREVGRARARASTGAETRSPRARPEDSHQDISYVSKFQPGRTITNDQVGAAQTRAQLAAHFLSPDIQRTRRFGSNYLGNNVFISGGLRIISDV